MGPHAPVVSSGGWSASPDALEVLELARSLADAKDVADAAGRTVHYARQLTGARWAELVEPRPGQQLHILATSDLELSRLLYQSRAGRGDNPPLPDLQPDTEQIVIEDLRSDTRWPNLVDLVADGLPVRSAVLQFLAVEGRYAAGLAVYDDRPSYFTQDRQRTVRVLGGLAGIVLAGLTADAQAHQLMVALRSNRVSATAVGIVMNRELLTQDQAFGRLKQVSQRTNRKLQEVAEEVILTGQAPALPAVRPGPVSGSGRTRGPVAAG